MSWKGELAKLAIVSMRCIGDYLLLCGLDTRGLAMTRSAPARDLNGSMYDDIWSVFFRGDSRQLSSYCKPAYPLALVPCHARRNADPLPSSPCGRTIDCSALGRCIHSKQHYAIISLATMSCPAADLPHPTVRSIHRSMKGTWCVAEDSLYCSRRTIPHVLLLRLTRCLIVVGCNVEVSNGLAWSVLVKRGFNWMQ